MAGERGGRKSRPPSTQPARKEEWLFRRELTVEEHDDCRRRPDEDGNAVRRDALLEFLCKTGLQRISDWEEREKDENPPALLYRHL